jgi:hypothetical protein
MHERRFALGRFGIIAELKKGMGTFSSRINCLLGSIPRLDNRLRWRAADQSLSRTPTPARQTLLATAQPGTFSRSAT